MQQIKLLKGSTQLSAVKALDLIDLLHLNWLTYAVILEAEREHDRSVAKILELLIFIWAILYF